MKTSLADMAVSVILLIAFGLSSCVYDPPEIFTEVSNEFTPPDYVINQTIDFEEDTLYAWNKTRFSFSFISSDQDIIAVTFNFPGNDLVFENSAGSFEVDPSELSDGSYEMTCKVYVSSGTGSLADKVGAEGYVYEKDFILIVERPGSTDLGFTHTTIDNGFLRIHWRKFDRSYFESYKITVYDSALYHFFTTTITDPETTSLVDSSFVGGSVKFTMLVTCKDGDGNKIDFGSDTYTYRYPLKLSFRTEGDSLTLSWTEIPFKHNIYYSSAWINLGQVKQYKISDPGLGDVQQYQISVAPVVKLTWDHQRYNMYELFSSGIKSDVKFTRMKYSPELDAYFTKDPMHVRRHDGNSLLMTGFHDYSWDYYDHNCLALSSDKASLFSTVNGNLLQFNSSTLEVLKSEPVAPYATGTKSPLLIQILNDDMMFLSFNSWLTLYNYNTGIIVDQEALETSSAVPYNLSISADGIYAANCGNGTLKVFRNNNNASLELVYEASGTFLECIFDPVDVHNLLVVTEEGAFVLNCPEMVLVHTIPDTVKGYPVNFDPVTNNLLFVSHRYNTLTVYDYKAGQILFVSPHHGYFDEFYLGKNRIIHSGGYYLNIDDHVK